jgi:hypothetical protein
LIPPFAANVIEAIDKLKMLIVSLLLLLIFINSKLLFLFINFIVHSSNVPDKAGLHRRDLFITVKHR